MTATLSSLKGEYYLLRKLNFIDTSFPFYTGQ